MQRVHSRVARATRRTRAAVAWVAVFTVSASLAHALTSALNGVALPPDGQPAATVAPAIPRLATCDGRIDACVWRVGTYNAWLITGDAREPCQTELAAAAWDPLGGSSTR